MNSLVVFSFFLFILVLPEESFGMTRPQLKKTMTIMKKQCMPKHGVTEDQVGQIEQGKFVEDPKVMCYIACIYKTIQVVKNNKLDKDLINKQIDILYPEDMKQPVKKAVFSCMGLQDNYSDMCEGIFYAAKCLYERDPANFVFP